MTNEYRIEVKVKNNNIIKWIEDAGHKTVASLCREHNMLSRQGDIGDLINLKSSPLNKKREFNATVMALCEALVCSPEDLFSVSQLNAALESNKRTFEVSEAEAQFMLQNMPEQILLEDIVANDERDVMLRKMLETLTPREQEIIKMRFGLDGNAPMTLGDIGKKFNVSPPRIRDIEGRVLRKLRHPTRSLPLRQLIFNEDK